MGMFDPGWLNELEEKQKHEKNAADSSRPLFNRGESAEKAGLDTFDSMMATVHGRERPWWAK